MPEQVHEGWIVAPTIEIPKDIKENFEQIEQALKKLVGANYEPFLYYGSKVADGISHMLICKLAIMSDPPEYHMVRA